MRENYFKWIFQQLSDIHDIEDADVDAFQLEYEENVCTNLPRSLVCTHKELKKFPYKDCEIDFGDEVLTPSAQSDNEEEKGDDNES